MPRRLLVRLLARLDRSPLPVSDAVRLELEQEVLHLIAAHADTVRAMPVVCGSSLPENERAR